MERNLLVGIGIATLVVISMVVAAIFWFPYGEDGPNGSDENTQEPVLSLVMPVADTTYDGKIPIKGSAFDEQGFGTGSSLQWKFEGDPYYGAWTEATGWNLRNAKNMDIDFFLDMDGLRTGRVTVVVRVCDGDNYSEPVEVPVTLE
ncbi:MAG: hypothetical protein GQ558_00470 [Thermoplasmata archaeon]|nr:hypothetical protein [Thermoplasmata archaeon]